MLDSVRVDSTKFANGSFAPEAAIRQTLLNFDTQAT